MEWEVILSKCPYCDDKLNISSLTTISEKEAIFNVMEMSKIHLSECRFIFNKKLFDLKIKEYSKCEKGYKKIITKFNKMLI